MRKDTKSVLCNGCGKTDGQMAKPRLVFLSAVVEGRPSSPCLFMSAGIQKLPPLLQKVGVVSYQHKNVIEKSFPTPRKFTGQEILFLSQNVIPIVGKSPKENKGGPCHHDRGVPLYVGVKQK